MTGADQLLEMREGVEALSRGARELFEAHEAEELERRPAEDAWSAAECLAHLTQTVRKYLPEIDAVIAEGRRENVVSHGPFHYGWMSRLFVRLVGPPVLLKIKAPAAFRVEKPVKAAEALEDFLWHHEALMGRMDMAAGLDLAKLKVRSPGNEKLQLELGVVFLMFAAHGRRHLEQARRAVEG